MRYDLTGQIFGKLLVIERDLKYGGFKQETRWKCVCECGNISSVRSYCLRKGHTKSCGCFGKSNLKPEASTKHGLYNTRTYHSWEQMKQRCLNPKATRYPTYGGVGITVCERWLEFKNFYEDMGDRPVGKTLDRINPYGNYEPSNCRWATYKEQVHNRRRNHVIPEEVKTLC